MSCLKNQGVAIVDAGGGTIDISAYTRTRSHEGKRTYEEIATSMCKRQGRLETSFSLTKFTLE